MPPDKDLAGVTEPVEDMALWLEKATGKPFQIKQGLSKNDEGIQLQALRDAGLPASIEKQLLKDGQSFYLEIKGGQSVRIVGTGVNSFSNGIYTFLHELGFRWYMPGDAWTRVPKLNLSKQKVAKVYTPDFQNRFYFGTGGIAAIPGLDPQNTFKKDFDTWNRRNRLSSDFPVKGHTGRSFFREKFKELEQHPEYFCKGQVNRNGRIDISNPAAVKLFTDWALDQIKPGDRFPVIGMDPADGSGGKDDCLPSNMKQVKSWSDKYFWLANQVAEQAEKNEENALVQLYAYSSHAAPPQFDLHRNVYPVIIPYAFQDVADPNQYIELWSRKMKDRPMGIYDYWNITQWSHDVPQFNIYSIPVKLKLWKKYNISTINLESTNAKGPMGHAFWLAAQMMWDTDQSFETLYSEFLEHSFGPAAAEIRRMYDRWSLNYQGVMDVALSLNDLASASSRTRDRAVQQRIAELKAYVHYLKLYYDYQQAPSEEGYTTLVNYIYSTHHLRLLQTHALQTLYIKTPPGYRKLSDKNVIADENVKIKPVGEQFIERNFKKDREEFSAQYTLSNFSFDFKKARPTVASGKVLYQPLYINGRISYRFYLAAPRMLSIQAGATKETKLVIKDEQGKVRLAKVVPGSQEGYEHIEVAFGRGEYILTFGEYSRFSRIIFPVDVAFFSSAYMYDNYRYPPLYVYIPKDAHEIIYTVDFPPNAHKEGSWTDASGNTVKAGLLAYSTFRVPVPPQQRGKVWTLNMNHRKFRILNLPGVFSLNPFEYKD